MTDNVNNNLQKSRLLDVSRISVRFGEAVAVRDVSFSVGRGEVFGLVGESGSGKTTAARSVMRLYNIDDGEICFKGERISCGQGSVKKKISSLRAKRREGVIDRREYYNGIRECRRELHECDLVNKRHGCGDTKGIQMIFQDPIASLDPRMTVGRAVAEGLIIQGVRDRDHISECVSRLLLRVGLHPEYTDRYPHEFSGGQRQRISIARALVMNPELVIADEPVSALDVSVQAQVINLLESLREEMGLAFLFIAHDLSVVKYFSDRIGVMRAGRMVECASSAELFERPIHPYTRALLSAIPLPDPLTERARKRIFYDPEKEHDYREEMPSFREISVGHFVLCNNDEEQRYRRDFL